jgi:hypothetical protein
MATETKSTPPPPPSESKGKSADTGDQGRGVSPEGVPYQAPGNSGRERKVREPSEGDKAHEQEVEDKIKATREAQRGVTA